MSDLFSIAAKWQLSLLFRILLPGFIFSLLLLPLIVPFHSPALSLDELADCAVVLLPGALVLGMLVSLLRNVVYRIYEGRLLWPEWLHSKLTGRIDYRVKERMAEAEKLDKSSVRYRELWYWLRIFPVDYQGNPVARRPTILGNVLEGYEDYPRSRYGMDAVFYWYRLRPTLPAGFVEQMDQLWAEADCLMYLSFSSLIAGMAYTALTLAKVAVSWIGSSLSGALTQAVTYSDLMSGWGAPGIWAAGCLIGGYLVYRFSVPLHRRNGEYFKAAFDLYRDNVIEITKVTPDEKARWREAWAYLQYMYVWCPHCMSYHYAEEEKCSRCGELQETQAEQLPRCK